jgi:putative heme-binding domain-containing protein
LSRPADTWFNTAILISAWSQSHRLLHELAVSMKRQPFRDGPPSELIELLTEASVVAQPAKELQSLVAAIAELDKSWAAHDTQQAFVRGWGRGRQRRGAALDQELARLPDGGDAIQQRLQDWILTAVQVAKNSERPANERVSAIQTLRWSTARIVPQVLLPLVIENGDTAVALAACEALAALPGDDIAAPLLERFPSAVPAVRRAILDVLLAQPGRAMLLLDAVERSIQDQTPVTDVPGSPEAAIRPAEIDPARANRLLNHRDAALRERAKKLLAAGSADRVAVIAQYNSAIEKLGDAQRGKAVFAKHCVTCHRIAGLGVNVGADIGDTRDKTPAYLLTAILDPNRAVDNNYFGYVIATNDGKTYTGVIAAETSTSVTLKQAEGKTETILRSDIEELRATGQSFMPVGFEKNITPAEMSDLISFLKNWRYLDGAVPAGIGAMK